MHDYGRNVSDKQKQLIDKYVELFNYSIEKDLKGGAIANFSSSLMENALRKMVQERIKDMDLSVEKCFVKDGEGRFTECDIAIYRKGEEDKVLRENFNTLVIDSKNVVAIVEVKSFADSTGLKHFSDFLDRCGLAERGYFVGITGSIKSVREGVDLNSKPKIFLLAKSSYANIRKGQKMQRDKVNDNLGVLEQFLKTLQDELVKLIQSI